MAAIIRNEAARTFGYSYTLEWGTLSDKEFISLFVNTPVQTAIDNLPEAHAEAIRLTQKKFGFDRLDLPASLPQPILTDFDREWVRAVPSPLN